MPGKIATNLLTVFLLGLFMSARKADRDFLNTASQANLAGIAAGKVAVQKAAHPVVRRLADSLVAGSQQAEQELEQIAHREGVDLATTPDTQHQRMTDDLTMLSGKRFDSIYIDRQLLAQQVAVQLFQRESGMGQDSLSRAYARKYLPALRHQLLMIKALTAKQAK